MKPLDFLDTNAVFNHGEFVRAHTTVGGRSRHTSNKLLAQHVASGRLLRVRRGLYATVPRGVEPERADVDPYLLATHLTENAIVAYHAALQYHGRTYTMARRFMYLARRRGRPFRFRDAEFVPVLLPPTLRDTPDMGGGFKEERHAGGTVRVTTLERTMVDVLDVPAYGGGWEEVWRSLESVEFFDLDVVVAYALRLGSALTVARVGFFLEQHREKLLVEDHYLDALRERAPTQASYLDRRREPGTLISGWNLVVPERVLRRTWEEVT